MDKFGLNQGHSDDKRHAAVMVPGCGAKNYPNGPIIQIEIEDSRPVLFVYADINQEEYTHKISLEHALESNRDEQEMSDVGKAANGSG